MGRTAHHASKGGPRAALLALVMAAAAGAQAGAASKVAYCDMSDADIDVLRARVARDNAAAERAHRARASVFAGEAVRTGATTPARLSALYGEPRGWFEPRADGKPGHELLWSEHWHHRTVADRVYDSPAWRQFPARSRCIDVWEESHVGTYRVLLDGRGRVESSAAVLDITR